MIFSHKLRAFLLSAFLIIITTDTFAEKSILCPNAKIFDGSIYTDICWTCMLPINVAAGSIWSSPENTPDGANTDWECACFDSNIFDWRLGVSAGLLVPSKLVETVRVPFCSPTLGGIILGESEYTVEEPPSGTQTNNTTQKPSTPSNLTTLLETVGTRSPWGFDATDLTRYHQHVYSFPLLYIMRVLTDFTCLPGGYNTIDMAFAPTEFIPTWSVDELAALTQPHAKLFSPPKVQLTCAYDAYMTTFKKPSDLFYCNGGDLVFPLHGNITDPVSALRTESITTARNLELNHELSLARKTFGKQAMCGSPPYAFTRPKQQYKYNLMYPVPEASGDCCHYLGSYDPLWGAGKVLPGPGENFVSLMFQWVDCCVNML